MSISHNGAVVKMICPAFMQSPVAFSEFTMT